MELNDSIRIAGVIKESIVDGPGIRFVVFCQGCPHRCEGCHNEATLDFQGGYMCEMNKIIKSIDANPLLAGVTFSGGEPFSQPQELCVLAKEIKERELNLIAYSGYTFEELNAMGTKDKHVHELLGYLDLLIDGQFELENRDLTLLYRGSSNQRIIDMNLSRKQGQIVLAEKYY